MKKNKTSKFLLAENPMLLDFQPLIYHSRKPRFLAKVVRMKFENKIFNDDENIIKYKNKNGNIELYKIIIIDLIDDYDTKGVLNRLQDWYLAYLIHKNKQTNNI